MGQSKLKALVTNIAMQCIKGVEATDMSDMLCTCKTQWYIMGMLKIIILGMLYLVTNKIRKWCFLKGCLFSNVVGLYATLCGGVASCALGLQQWTETKAQIKMV